MCIRSCCVLCLCLAGAAAAASRPLPRVAEAEVREGAGGVPCFTIAEREERRSGAPSFQAIRVAGLSQRPPAILWAMQMPPERTFPLMFSMCIPYAGRVAALPQRQAEALETATLYEVEIGVRVGSDGAAPLAYRARFCLARRADGSKAVKLLASDARSAAACGGAASAPGRAGRAPR